MKKITLLLCAILIYSCGKPDSKTNNLCIRDGFYEVIAPAADAENSYTLQKHQIVVPVDTLSNPGDYSRIIIDTTEYVPLELECVPTTEQQSQSRSSEHSGQGLSEESEKVLSISLTPDAATKIKMFTAKRITKQVAIVLDGKVITMHKVRDTISGGKMQITGSSDNACEYLCVKMKDKVRK